MTPMAWANVRRLVRARQLIDSGEPIAGVAADLGFVDQAHFTKRFKAVFGVTPARWRQLK